jgi:broad specificity phosphatase PhoE
MTRWLLVRHGETEWNRTDRAQGQSDVPLNNAGRNQARSLARALAATPFDAAYASDLSRAAETANLLLSGRDGPSPSLAPDLRELSFGRWEGFTYAEAEKDNPALFAKMLNRDPDFCPPGGERTQDLIARAQSFVDRVRAAQPEGVVLIVGHGGSLRALITILLRVPPDSFRQFTLDPASLSIMDVRQFASTLMLLNDTSHYRPNATARPTTSARHFTEVADGSGSPGASRVGPLAQQALGNPLTDASRRIFVPSPAGGEGEGGG